MDRIFQIKLNAHQINRLESIFFELNPKGTKRLEVGQQILVGPHNDKARITKIEYHKKSGEVELKTTRGPRKALTFKLCEQTEPLNNPADKYR